MKKLIANDFSLAKTIESGQFFLFEKVEDYYYFIIEENLIKIKQEDNILLYEGINKNQLINFLSLNVNYIDLIKDFNNDKYLSKALKNYYGLRILRQPLWETIVGFVCSSASNIPKIRMNLMLISEFFGEKKHCLNRTYYSFPKPGEIDNLDLLIKAKLGYRAKYVYKINNIIKENPFILQEIDNSSYEEAKQKLILFPGIGEKIADCICLFALGHGEACPIDTWMKQATEKFYLKRKAKNNKEINDFLKQKFKKNLGIKQQYLFEYIRNLQKNNKLKK